MGIASFFSPFHVGSQRRVKPCGLYISKRDDLFANNTFISLSNRTPQLFPVEIPTNGRLPNPPFILDRKSTRLNSSHVAISYAVFCLKKKKITHMKKTIGEQHEKESSMQQHL